VAEALAIVPCNKASLDVQRVSSQDSERMMGSGKAVKNTLSQRHLVARKKLQRAVEGPAGR
jgi:hypothetical protein